MTRIISSRIVSAALLNIALSVFFFAIPASAQTGPAFANPSFESPAVGACPASLNSPSGTGWTFSASAGITTGGCSGRYFAPALPPNGGTQAAYFQSAGETESVSQTVSGFQIGHSYTVTFYAAGRPRGGGCSDNCTETNFSVLVGGTDVLDVVNPPTNAFKAYTTSSFIAVGNVTISFSGAAAAGANGSSFIDLVSIQDTPPVLQPPTINPSGIVPVFSSATTIAPGSWCSVYGTNLAATATTWNGNFPNSLGGTSVTVNGKAASLWFVSPTQINFQAPDDTATGTVLVTVTTAAGSASSTVTLSPYAPSFSLLNAKYPAAIVPTSNPGNSGAGYDYIGPTGTFSFPTRPVKSGETILLYGVGFGPTTPSVPAGQLFSGAAPAVTTPLITIGNVSALVQFAGIVEAGLFQFNVVVPSLPSGDQPLLATVNGVSTPAGVFLTVQ